MYFQVKNFLKNNRNHTPKQKSMKYKEYKVNLMKFHHKC